MVSYPRRLKSGQITCYLNRTYHVLTTLCFQSIDNDSKSSYAPPLSAPTPRCPELPVRSDPATPVTRLLLRWREGDRQALEQLMPLVYAELRRMASHHLRRERGDHTLQSTALVHEAYLRLAGQDPPL